MGREWILFIVFVLAIGGYLLFRKLYSGRRIGKRVPSASNTPAYVSARAVVKQRVDFARLQPGGRISYGQIDFVVRRNMRLYGKAVTLYRLTLVTKTRARCWLLIERTRQSDLLTMWGECTYSSEPLTPEREQLTYDNATYKRISNVVYSTVSPDTKQAAGARQVEYIRYQGPSGRLLSFERVTGSSSWAIGIGQVIDASHLRIYTPV